MTHEPRLDGPAVDWIRSGPDRAPDQVLDAALAHARAHPHGRLRAWLAGSSVMRPLRLVRADDAPSNRASRAWAGAAAVVIVRKVFMVLSPLERV